MKSRVNLPVQKASCLALCFRQMPVSPKAARRKKRKKVPIPINPGTGLPYSVGTMKMRLLKRLKCTQKFERLALAAGAKLISGIDEGGRRSLFGPAGPAAGILEPHHCIKRLLAPQLVD